MRRHGIDGKTMNYAKPFALLLIACLLSALSAAQSPRQEDRAQPASGPEAPPGNSHEFYFTRGIYSGEFDDYDEGGRWAIDYPKADHQFLVALKRLSVVDAYGSDNAIE